MTEAYIYDAVRTPRGKGRPDGSLHEVTSLALSAIALLSLKAMGAVAPIGGLLMILAWLLLAVCALRAPSKPA